MHRNRLERSWKVTAGGHRASELVLGVLGESERLVFDAQQVPGASCAPLLQHEPAGVFPSRLLLRPLLHPLPPEPPAYSRCSEKTAESAAGLRLDMNSSYDSQFEGALAVFAAAQQVTVVLLQLPHLHQLPFPLLLPLLPLQPQPEGLLWVAGLFLGEKRHNCFKTMAFQRPQIS